MSNLGQEIAAFPPRLYATAPALLCGESSSVSVGLRKRAFGTVTCPVAERNSTARVNLSAVHSESDRVTTSSKALSQSLKSVLITLGPGVLQGSTLGGFVTFDVGTAPLDLIEVSFAELAYELCYTSSFQEDSNATLFGGSSATQAAAASTFQRFINALSEWKGLLAPHHYDAMEAHARRLLGDEAELEEEGVMPSASSFDDLLGFLASRPWDKAPAVGLDVRGHFSAAWGSRGVPSDVTLTFLGGGVVKWYLYGVGDGSESRAGTAASREIARLLREFGADHWMGVA